MIERLVVDTNAWVVWFRGGKPESALLERARKLVIPLPVVGELYAGAYASMQQAKNIGAIDDLSAKYEILVPDLHTARIYGQLRARMNLTNIRGSKMNDLWIAALCLQHSVPLLTNDRGFDSIEGLAVVHW